MKTRKKLVNVITLGCSKNLVDSEYLLKQLKSGGFDTIHDSDRTDVDVVVINTCGFINDAKQESIEMILQYEELRNQGDIEKLIVFGCLSERYKEDLKNEIPGVDHFFGVYDHLEMIKAIGTDYKNELRGERELTTPSHYAYLKIAEGCDRSCSFCAIPLIKGPHKSKKIEDIVSEAANLAKKGVKELLLIAQDLTYYGVDLYNDFKLPELVDKLSNIKGIEWVRIHYTYPNKFPLRLLKLMAEKKNVCNYLDIPFQHISDNVLKNMRRGIDKKGTMELIQKIKSEVPGIAIRTTLLVGHPGETEENFSELLDFIRDVEFSRLGVFTYSEEENTYAAKNFTDDIPQTIKQARADELMEVQSEISLKLNKQFIGKTLKVIIDRVDGEYFVGRTEYDSPEVDNEVLVSAENLKIGKFYDVEITDADMYELYGQIKK